MHSTKSQTLGSGSGKMKKSYQVSGADVVPNYENAITIGFTIDGY